MSRYLSPDDLRELDSAGLNNLAHWRREERNRLRAEYESADLALSEAEGERTRRAIERNRAASEARMIERHREWHDHCTAEGIEAQCHDCPLDLEEGNA